MHNDPTKPPSIYAGPPMLSYYEFVKELQKHMEISDEGHFNVADESVCLLDIFTHLIYRMNMSKERVANGFRVADWAFSRDFWGAFMVSAYTETEMQDWEVLFDAVDASIKEYGRPFRVQYLIK